MNQVPVAENVTGRGVDEKEWRPGSALLQRHEGGGDGARAVAAQELRQVLDAGRPVECLQGKAFAGEPLDGDQQFQRLEGITAQFKKADVDAEIRAVEN